MIKNTTITAALILCALFGYMFGYSRGNKAAVAAYADKVAAINRILPPQLNPNVITGIVKAISGNTIVLEKILISQDPIALDYPAIRQVTVANDASITMRTLKDVKTLQTELVASKKGTSVQAPPSLFYQKNITVSDIKVGDTITVVSSENIQKTEKFTVNSVQVVGVVEPAPTK